jgi:amino acid transporter
VPGPNLASCTEHDTFCLNLVQMRKISDEETADKDPTQKESGERSLGVLGLTALLFFNVGGGPFGTEGLQQSGGPFFSVIGLLILSLVWSLPVGLMTAELGTAFPRDGGYVLWVEAAFGEFWAFQVHSSNFLIMHSPTEKSLRFWLVRLVGGAGPPE